MMKQRTTLSSVEAKLGAGASDDKIEELLKEVASSVNDQLPNYKKIKKVVLRKTEFEKNTSKKIKRY